MKRLRIGLLGAVVSILALYFIASQIDMQALMAALARARYVYVVPTIVLLLAGLVTRALRWRVLLGGALPLGRAFSIMNVAYLVNGILPLRIGEVARIYLGTRASPPVPALKAASTIIVERLLDLLAVVILLALALTAGPVPDELKAAAAFAVPASIGGFIILVILSGQRGFIRRMLKNDRLRGWAEHFLDGLQPLTQASALGQALFWTAVSWGFSTAAGYILMFAFFPEGSWAATCLYIAAAAFAIAVPAVPGNLGPYELSILLALSAAGYGEPRDVAAAFALVVHGVNLGVHATTGLIGFIQEGISLGQLSEGVQQMRQTRMVAEDGLSRE